VIKIQPENLIENLSPFSIDVEFPAIGSPGLKKTNSQFSNTKFDSQADPNQEKIPSILKTESLNELLDSDLRKSLTLGSKIKIERPLTAKKKDPVTPLMSDRVNKDT
jgi:hypothetical protein